MKSILWVGVVIKTDNVSKYKAVSAAANNWQLRFLSGLLKNGVSVYLFSYLPDSYWPKGKLVPKLCLDDLPKGINITTIKYINFPLLRELTLGLNLIVNVCKRKFSFDLLITYNPFKRHILLGTFVKYFLLKKWALIIADGDMCGDPDLGIYLSHSTFSNKSGRKLFLQGGTACFNNVFCDNVEKRIVLYSGNISELTGIVQFAKLFDELKINEIELHVYGKGNDKFLNNLKEYNENIKVFGFVSESTLEIAMQNAWVFINPRNLQEETKLNTFPSKILEYLRYGKPIISTCTSSLSSSFDDFIIYYDQNDSDTLKNVFTNLKEANIQYFNNLFLLSKEYCNKNSWENVTKNFLIDLTHKFKDDL